MQPAQAPVRGPAKLPPLRRGLLGQPAGLQPHGQVRAQQAGRPDAVAGSRLGSGQQHRRRGRVGPDICQEGQAQRAADRAQRGGRRHWPAG